MAIETTVCNRDHSGAVKANSRMEFCHISSYKEEGVGVQVGWGVGGGGRPHRCLQPGLKRG